MKLGSRQPHKGFFKMFNGPHASTPPDPKLRKIHFKGRKVINLIKS